MNFSVLNSCSLFRNISEEEIKSLFHCCKGRIKKYQKDDIIWYAGINVSEIGLVLEGVVTIESNDYWGNKTIFSHVGRGEVFGEAYAYLDNMPLLVDVVASCEVEVLFIDIKKITLQCSNLCSHHQQLLYNLLALFASKNIRLSQKIFHTSEKSIRSRLLSYFYFVSEESKSKKFTIPFKRQQLADYLNVERSALCAEMSKMKNEGLIDYHLNEIELL